MSKVFDTSFLNYDESVARIFNAMKPKIEKRKIVIKPNLTTNLNPPVTTDVNCVRAILKCLQNFNGEIIIAEGSGGCDTLKAFNALGYEELCEEFGIRLIDLNREERVEIENHSALRLKSMLYPKILLDSYLISVPVPKEHSSAIITNSLKNMFGVYLSKKYLAKYSGLRKIGVIVARSIFARGWSKADLHVFGVHESIYDLNLYKKPDLTICDARIGQKGNEIDGVACKPPLNRIIGAFDPVACDSYVSKIFGYDWKEIKYLRYCHEKIGDAENVEVVRI
ncbi:MAG: DUF362 domain-containing protein [Candidatus Aenigmatarchaeota archaeon]